jgi:hypothetical protein
VGETVRGRNPDGKLQLRRNTTLREDFVDTVKGLVRMASPRPLRERKTDLDDMERRYEGQTTDSNNRY